MPPGMGPPVLARRARDAHVAKTATADEIKKAHRKLALKNHLDRNDGREEEAQVKMQAINTAYATLSDPEKRKVYDMYGDQGLQMVETMGVPAWVLSPVAQGGVGCSILCAVLIISVLLPAFILLRIDAVVEWHWAVVFIPLWFVMAPGRCAVALRPPKATTRTCPRARRTASARAAGVPAPLVLLSLLAAFEVLLPSGCRHDGALPPPPPSSTTSTAATTTTSTACCRAPASRGSSSYAAVRPPPPRRPPARRAVACSAANTRRSFDEGELRADVGGGRGHLRLVNALLLVALTPPFLRSTAPSSARRTTAPSRGRCWRRAGRSSCCSSARRAIPPPPPPRRRTARRGRAARRVATIAISSSPSSPSPRCSASSSAARRPTRRRWSSSIFILLALVRRGCCALCMGMAAAAGAGMEMPPDMEQGGGGMGGMGGGGGATSMADGEQPGATLQAGAAAASRGAADARRD